MNPQSLDPIIHATRPQILIADPDRSFLEDVSQKLILKHYRVATSAHGLQCIQLLQELRPEILLLNLQIPWGGGQGVLTWLRWEGNLPHLRVILMSPGSQDKPWNHALIYPIETVLSTPVTLSELERTLEKTGNPSEDSSLREWHHVRSCK